jgi:hypothetical protein
MTKDPFRDQSFRIGFAFFTAANDIGEADGKTAPGKRVGEGRKRAA